MGNWVVTTKDTAAEAVTFIATQDSTVLMHVTPYPEGGKTKFMIAVAS
ncbi:MAG: hypothetical protein KAJ03_01780 [Gammaproteobacteria bacterium]|nr:hypothetical protein [Gammaproteobacteria bacterium]